MSPEYMRSRAAEQLAHAVKTMREACDRAERDLSKGDGTACQRVLHALSWGFANASSSIETAMSHVEDSHVIAAIQREGDRHD